MTTLQAKIGQMIVVRAAGYLFDHQRRYPAWEADNSTLQHWLETLNLGGVILLGGSALELKTRAQQLQSWAQTPLFIAADIEEGVGHRFPGATWFPPPMALGAIANNSLNLAEKYATYMGAITAREAIAVGINWLLAPVVDVNNNPQNPVINIRAFSDLPEIVTRLTTAFITGAQQYSVLTTAKHFPGHGDTETDSHLDLPTIFHDNSRLNELELLPFKSAIAAGVDSVMTAHLMIPAWDKCLPVTLSSHIVTDKLRSQLGFDGLIVTDALIMGGITKYDSPEEIAVMAVEAGSDILLMPEDPQIAIESVYQAVLSGRITEERIDQSLVRIQTAKNKLGLIEGKNIVQNQNSVINLASCQSREIVQDILRNSLQQGGNFPLIIDKEQTRRNLLIVDDVLNSNFLDLNSPAIAIPQQMGYQRQVLDQNSLTAVNTDSRKTLLQIFVRGNPFRGSAGLTPDAIAEYQILLKSGNLEGLIIYGSPYVKDWLLSQLSPNVPWIFIYGQMDLGQAIALNIMFNLQSFPTYNDRIFVNQNIEDFGF